MSRPAITPTPGIAPPRLSLWLLCAAMICLVALKPDRAAWPHWQLPGWPLLAAGLLLAWRHPVRTWGKTAVLLAWTVVLLRFTRVDGDTSNGHVLELVLKLGVGILLVPALAARFWLKEPLDYSWLNGRWSRRMLLWLVAGFLLAYGILRLYFHHWTP